MSDATGLPLWAALPISLMLVGGAALALVGSIGLVTLRGFFDRLHAPTLGTTLGMGLILIASMLFFSVLETRFVLHEILIAILMVVTTPVTLMLLARATLHREQRESGNDAV